jgi:DMSO/TMAO reductase YedYZ heme-binding membrane subunit
MLCLVGALVEKARWGMWLAVMPFALLLSVAFLALQIGPGVYFFARLRDLGGALEMIVLLSGVVPLTLCYGGVLLLSILLWPLKVFSGWRAGWSDEVEGFAGKAPISHLMMWVGLWGALFLLATTLAEGFGAVILIAGFVALVLVFITGFPVTILLSGDRWTPLRRTALVSFIESELVYWVAQPPGLTSITRVLPLVLAFNASLAGMIALNCHLMSRQGLRLHMPLPWWRGKPPSPSFTGKPINS